MGDETAAVPSPWRMLRQDGDFRRYWVSRRCPGNCVEARPPARISSNGPPTTS